MQRIFLDSGQPEQFMTYGNLTKLISRELPQNA